MQKMNHEAQIIMIGQDVYIYDIFYIKNKDDYLNILTDVQKENFVILPIDFSKEMKKWKKKLK